MEVKAQSGDTVVIKHAFVGSVCFFAYGFEK